MNTRLRKILFLIPLVVLLLAGSIYMSKQPETESTMDFPGEDLVHPAPSAKLYFEPTYGELAWENDKVVFWVYGASNVRSIESSGIGLWFKRVDYPVLESWYDLALNDVRSLEEDNGEGYVDYTLADTMGCGGSALWIDGQMIRAGTYSSYKVVKDTREKIVFVITYDYPNGIVEEKMVSIRLEDAFFRIHSSFRKDGKPVPHLTVALGLTKQTDEAFVQTDAAEKLIQLRENVREEHVRMYVRLEKHYAVKEFREQQSAARPELFLLTETDVSGYLAYKVGYEME